MPDAAGGPIRLLALIEAYTVSGPAKNLLEFCRLSRDLFPQPPVLTTLATFVRGNPDNEFLQAVGAAGIEIHPIAERFACDLRTISEVRRLVQSLSPDLIQTHGTKSHFLLRLSGLWRNHPWIAFHHGYTTDARRTTLFNQLDRWSLRAPAQIVTVCHPFKRQLALRGAPAERISVVHNAISEEWLKGEVCAHAEAGDGIANRRRTILAVGRLSREKAFIHLLAAVEELRRRNPRLPFRLTILGDGPERSSLERRIQAAGLRDYVTLQGHVADVRPYLADTDLLAISSISEGSPNALLEAMCAGIPVVATAVGGIPEIVNHQETGLLVPPGDAPAMASALSLLLQDATLARNLARKAQDLLHSRHSSQTRTRTLVELYQNVYLDHRRRTGRPSGGHSCFAVAAADRKEF